MSPQEEGATEAAENDSNRLGALENDANSRRQFERRLEYLYAIADNKVNEKIEQRKIARRRKIEKIKEKKRAHRTRAEKRREKRAARRRRRRENDH